MEESGEAERFFESLGGDLDTNAPPYAGASSSTDWLKIRSNG